MTYPYSTPIILTDSIFSSYGGNVGSTTQAQRQAAYTIAEQRVSDAIGTLLRLTIVTGTYAYPNVGHFSLEYNRVSRIIRTTFLDFQGVEILSEDGEASGYINVRDKETGDVDVVYSGYGTHSHSAYDFVYQTRIVYEAGLSSGTTYHPNILLALSTEADVVLNEIVGYGNEGAGDIGIQSFNNQEYSENRVTLRNTVLGNSPRTNFANRLLEPFRVRSRGLGL
jgi:hypothetical protein